MKKYYRVTYEKIGIYEAVKNQIWKKSKTPASDWQKFLNDQNICWLNKPNYNNGFSSFFTEKGFLTFKEKSYPIIILWLDRKKIETKIYYFKDEKDIVYQDKDQIVMKEADIPFKSLKFQKVLDGTISNANGFKYKINEINKADKWNLEAKDPNDFGGFNFSTEEKIFRWLLRGDTIYDVELPSSAEIIECENKTAPSGVFRSNQII